MSHYAPPVLLGLFIWWFSTGLILFLDGLPRRTFRWSMTGATALLAVALYGLIGSAGDTSVTGAYTAFTSAVVIWGWLEISFYMGYVTGPRTHHCRHGCAGWAHFGHAIQASLYHEIAVLILAGAVYGLTRGCPNQFGTWTFITLWWMHQSARLNVFLGVKNLNAEFLPEHLSHIGSFFRSAPMNMLFPFSVTLSTIAAVLLGQQALARPADAFHTAGYMLVTTMMVLAILEHWFLVLPLPAAKAWNRLWEWSLGSRGTGRKMPRHQQSPLPTQATIGGHP
ncbi:MAG: photosynthetic complex assembly protein 2 [Rhodospirillales bacterium 20-64-7]|nr:MAG: photosynthetic complex assembly protein 2 [Rhodospirillales bacterium 20-64-7]HQT77862.1 putative photosynthetic complex assembly protein PuhE [Rhodopila sp.]